MRKYQVSIVGLSSILMHADDVEEADKIKRWEKDPANKSKSVKGDDRSPAFKWIGYTYRDHEQLVIPQENIMKCLMEGGAMVSTGKGPKTFKSQTQSGMVVDNDSWPLLVNGKTIPLASIEALMKEDDFDVHKDVVKRIGFDLFVKRATVGTAKHVRVRPRFKHWSTTGTISVWDDALTTAVLTNIVTYAGRYKGLGDWRPGGKTPGSFGMFNATIAEV